MPFKSKAQQRACYAKDDPNWDCEEFSASTDQKNLPEKVGGERTRIVEFYLNRAKEKGWGKEATSRTIKQKLVRLQARRDPVKQQALEKGTRVEMEHTDDRNKAEDIAADHLSETWDYYDKLEKCVGDKHAGLFRPKLHPQAVQMAQGTLPKGHPLVDVPPKHIYQAAMKHKNYPMANQAHQLFGVGAPVPSGGPAKKPGISSRIFQAFGKRAEVNPLVQYTPMDAVPRGDEVHSPLLENKYDQPGADERDAIHYENGYQFAQALGHRELGQVSPENIETWNNRPVSWRDGLADGASSLGMGRVADMMQAAGGEAQMNKQGEAVFVPMEKEARKGGNWGSRLSTLAGGLAGAGLASSQGGKGNKIAPITGGAVGALVGHGVHKAISDKLRDKKDKKDEKDEKMSYFVPMKKEAAVPQYEVGRGGSLNRTNPKPSGNITITPASMKKDKPVNATIAKPTPKRPNTFVASGGGIKRAEHGKKCEDKERYVENQDLVAEPSDKIASRLGNLAGMAGLLGGAAVGADVGSDIGGAVGGAPSAMEHFQAADPSALNALQGTGEVAGGVAGGAAGGLVGHGVGKTMGNMVNTVPKPAPRGAMDAI